MYHYTARNIINSVHPVIVHLVGVGGTGSRLLPMLAEIDIAVRKLGHNGGLSIAAFDPDTVQEPNIGRQGFTVHDIGDNKGIALIEKLNRYYEVDYKAIPYEYSIDAITNFSKAPDILVSCTDTGKSRVMIGKIMKQIKNPIYWLDCGNSLATGQVILGTTGEIRQPEGGVVNLLPTVLDFAPDIASDDGATGNIPSCSLAEALHKQDLFINRMMATFAGDLIWRMFRQGRIKNHGCFVDLKMCSTHPITVKSSYNFFFQKAS